MSTDKGSGDIFYEVKKEILDKLDIILQKINLEIINSRPSTHPDFTFIELAQFELEISTLFQYLDKLYDSLSSSVSYSSYVSRQDSLNEHLAKDLRQMQEDKRRLEEECQQLESQLKRMQSEYKRIEGNKKWIQNEKERVGQQLANIMKENRRKERKVQQKLAQVKDQVRECERFIKVTLKEYKFELLENRVEIMGKLKEVKEREGDALRGKENRLLGNSKTSSSMSSVYCEGCEPMDREIRILQELDDILNMC